ncbi:unnamed protein product [Boreogadus saida]
MARTIKEQAVPACDTVEQGPAWVNPPESMPELGPDSREYTAGLQSLPVSPFYSWEGKGLLSSTGELRGIHRMRGPAQSPTASPTLCPRLKGLAA